MAKEENGFVSCLPNYKRAEIPQRKLGSYLLNPDKSNGKSVFFNSIGYHMKNADRFEQDLRKGLETSEAKVYNENEYGLQYQVDMPLGINKTIMVTTAWQIDNGKHEPRFITAYPAEKKKKG